MTRKDKNIKINVISKALQVIYNQMFPGGVLEEKTQVEELTALLGNDTNIEDVAGYLKFVLSMSFISGTKSQEKVVKSLLNRNNKLTIEQANTIYDYAIGHNERLNLLISKSKL